MKYEIAETAKRQARALGFSGDVEACLRNILAVSVPVSHMAGNRGAGAFILRVAGSTLLTVERRGPRPVASQPRAECHLCGGTGVRQVETASGRVVRTCPRATNPAYPRCDLP